MNTGNCGPRKRCAGIAAFSLDVQALDLGGGVKAVGLGWSEPKTASRYEARMLRKSGRRLPCPCRDRIVRRGFF